MYYLNVANIFLHHRHQGKAVLAAFGTIVGWALILGAIVWGISLVPFSGFFTGEFFIVFVHTDSLCT
jgi:hypothetical protein